jgi:hypothetical protein
MKGLGKGFGRLDLGIVSLEKQRKKQISAED